MTGYLSPPPYRVSLVDLGGDVVAAAQFQPRSFGGGLPNLPTVSAGSDRVYYLSGDSTIDYLTRSGATGQAARIAMGSKSVATFAVKPDGTEAIVSVIDYSAARPTTEVFVQAFSTGARREIFSSSSVYEWPVLWTPDGVVMELGADHQQNVTDEFLWSAPIGFHLIDPGTGDRLASLCPPHPSPYEPRFTGYQPTSLGIICSSETDSHVLNWQGQATWTIPPLRDCGSLVGWVLSPDGRTVAAVDPVAANCRWSPGDPIVLHHEGGGQDVISASGEPMGWLDSQNLVVIDTKAGKIAWDQAPRYIYNVATRVSTPVRLPATFLAGVIPSSA